MLYLVTYATHNQGMLKNLIYNEFGVKVHLLGWNTKWNNFMDKYKGVLSFCENINDNDTVVFLDGFDTEINKYPKDVERLFNDMNCDVLVSKEPNNMVYFKQKVFGTCQEHYIANSGLYMGKNHNIKRFLRQLLFQSTDDDQVALNNICKTSNLDIKIDIDSVIFHNGKTENDAYFVSYPAGENESFIYKLNRYYRGIFEYLPYFKYEIAIIILILILSRNIYKIMT